MEVLNHLRDAAQTMDQGLKAARIKFYHCCKVTANSLLISPCLCFPIFKTGMIKVVCLSRGMKWA